MAYQAGPLRLRGKLGDLSFYYNKQHGYLVRQKGGPAKEQLVNSPSFERARENTAEFALAAVVGKLIRHAVRAAVGLKGDPGISQRLTGLLVRIGKTDLSATRGRRNPAAVFDEPHSRELLQAFAFYGTRPVSAVYAGRIDCDTLVGAIILTTSTSDAQAPASDFFHAPKGATHVRIKASIVDLDFERKQYTCYPAPVYTASLEAPLIQHEFVCDVEATVSFSRIGVVAIEFLQEKNGEFYLLNEGMSLGLV